MQAFPLPASSSYSYARRFARGVHDGCDIFAPEGTPVLAVVAGLAHARIEPKGGNCIYLEGDDARRYYFGHLKTWSLPLLARGSLEVAAGEQIGEVGTTGNAAGKAPHLHFEMKLRGRTFDPFDDLVAVDPHHRGRGGGSPEGLAVAVLVLWWLASQASCAVVAS